MPFVDNDKQVVQPALPQPVKQEEGAEDNPSLLETAGAALRTENIIGSALSSKVTSINPRDRFEVDPNFNPFDDEEISSPDGRFFEHQDAFLSAQNETVAKAIKLDIQREQKDKRILDASGLTGTALSIGSAIVDPTILIPGGTFVKGARAGFSVARSSASVGAAAGVATAVQETALHATQQTRTGEETALAVGGSVILGGLLGAAGAKILTKQQFASASKAIEEDIADGIPNVNELTEEIISRAQSAGAAAVDDIDLSDLDVAGPKVAKAAAQITSALRINPGVQTLLSPSKEARKVFSRLADNNVATELEARGETLGPSVENLVKEYQRGKLASWLKDRNALFKSARKDGFNLGLEEFNKRVGRALRRGDVDPEGNEFITQAAQAARAKISAPLLKEAQSAGLLPDDIKTTTAASYFTRLWNKQTLISEESEFRRIAKDYLSKEVARALQRTEEVKIGERFVNLELENSRLANSQNRLNRLDKDFSKTVSRRKTLEGRIARRQAKDNAPRPTASTAASQDISSELRGAIGNPDVFIEQVKSARKHRAERKKVTRFPVLALIKEKGGVRVGSSLDQELRAIGVTPKSQPGLFKKPTLGNQKPGIGDVDNFVINEEDVLSVNVFDDGTGYASKEDIFDGISAELSGNPWATNLDDALNDDAADYIDELLTELGFAGNPTIKEIRSLLKTSPDARKTVGDSGDIVTNLQISSQELETRISQIDDERIIAKSEVEEIEKSIASINDSLADVTEAELSLPAVRNTVEYSRKKRDISKNKIKQSRLQSRIDEIERAASKSKLSDELTAELSAAKSDIGDLTLRIVDAEKAASKLEKFLPKNKLDADDFVSDADLEGYIDDAVSSVFNNLTGRGSGEVPAHIVPLERGPLKGRTFRIQDELVEQFLEDDAEAVLRHNVRNVAPEIELTKTFGRADLKDQLDAITKDYEQLRAETTDQKRLKFLSDYEARDKKNLAAFRDQIRGTYLQAQEGTAFGRITRAALAWNYVRLLGGVTLTSTADVARIISTHGTRAFMTEAFPALVSNIKAVKLSAADAKELGAVTEQVLQSRLASLAELQDPNAVGSPLERILQNGTTTFSKATGLPLWNDSLKTIASLLTQNRMIKNSLVGDYAKLDKYERLYMGKMGINEHMAERIAQQFKKHGSKDGTVYVANVETWDDAVARRTYGAALNKDVDRTIVTKGVSDQPLWTRTNAGRLITQFRTFGLASHQRVLLAGLQERPRRLAEMLIAGGAMGMMISWLKLKERGDDERANALLDNLGQWSVDGLDRSGLLAIPFEANNTIEKLAAQFGGEPIGIGAQVGKLVGDKGSTGGATRFASRNALGVVLGPTGGLFQDLAQIASIPAKEKTTKGDANALIRQIPGGTLPGVKTLLQTQAKPALQDALN